MAGDYGMSDYGDNGNVKFNAGFFQIQRIHEVQRMINISKINPTTFNVDYNLWNYQLWFNCLNTLLDEVWPKLDNGDGKGGEDDDKGEKGPAAAIREKMVMLVANMSVLEDKTVSAYSDKVVTVVNQKKWGKLHLALITYDNFIKELMNKHGWNNPDGDFEAEDEY